MADYTGVFERVEQKYLLDSLQFAALWTVLEPYMRPDEYGRSTICNIYFDTPNHLLARLSGEKPVYKEKLRLRTYGVPKAESSSFVELKKKYQGIVYKRRIVMPYGEAYDWLVNGKAPKENSQIAKEIAWSLHYYGDLKPAMALCYDRVALYSREDSGLRITFDTNIRFREENTDLRQGDDGQLLLEPGETLMEIKAGGGLPTWLTDMLSRFRIYPASFSKYVSAYNTHGTHIVHAS